MKTRLEGAGGFTPIIDALVPEFGLVGAALFGRVWRFCQGQRGVCQATTETIGEGLGISRRTVQRHLSKLCQAGYLQDSTPGLKNRPHTYRDTGKIMPASRLAVTESHPAVSESHSAVPQRRAGRVRKSHKDSRDTSKIVKRQPTGRNLVRKLLEERFVALSGLPPPSYRTQKDKRMAGERWGKPLLTMAALENDHIERTAGLMQEALQDMDANKLTVSAPASILKVATSIHARRVRQGGNGPGRILKVA